jgi:hypothetical protein
MGNPVTAQSGKAILPVMSKDASLERPASDFTEVEVRDPIVNCSKRDRKAQRETLIRVDQDVYFKDREAGVEVCGNGAWRGMVPWSNIKLAKR